MDNLEEKFQALQLQCSELTHKLASAAAKQKELEQQILEIDSVKAENQTLLIENQKVKELQQQQMTLQDELTHAKFILESIATSPTFRLAQKIAVISKRISRILKR